MAKAQCVPGLMNRLEWIMDPRDGQGAEVTWPSHLALEMRKLRSREGRRVLPVVTLLDLLPSWDLTELEECKF